MTGLDHQASERDTDISDVVAGSLSLVGAVSLGTSVMIGAGIFAITGQMAGLAGDLASGTFQELRLS